ncbi:MAG: threonylcarbamoyl-AMP synthase [Chryseobacterium sp.]|uniref:L-threonylcarbamoyladenylate synthase n=1 Tax=Pedobacter agri TaxID=454586 RepID=UPI0011FCE7A5|nr:L-threonylcarbamoyladenylate synthase [Pedobacter agri]MDQ1142108.1 L-threonylcarbamoyladenylate synthase [Pedobacter agri]RZJ86741.1 MAG: threonylcarbamoyl-AMP synthase [Chryseobacterium sp.]
MLKDEINKALEVIKNGGVILYPTDTIWGLGCDATNAAAVDKLLKIKNRPAEKSLIVLLDVDSKLQSYVKEIPEVAYDLIEYAENPLTIIFSDAKNLATNVINADGSVGIRIVKHDFCTPLIQRFRKPIVSTSANLSGKPSPKFFDDIDPEILDAVDYVVDFEQENRNIKKPSTIMKLTPSGQFEFIRK